MSDVTRARRRRTCLHRAVCGRGVQDGAAEIYLKAMEGCNAGSPRTGRKPGDTSELDLGANSTAILKLTSGGGVQVGSPTGGDKGAGTLNATTVYQNGTAITTNPFMGFFAQAGSHSNSTSFLPISSPLVGSATTEAGQQSPVCDAVTITKLYVSVQAAPGGSDSYAFTLRKNGVDTAVTATITGAATTASDTAHSVSFAAGDLWCIKLVGSATAVNDVGAHGSIGT